LLTVSNLKVNLLKVKRLFGWLGGPVDVFEGLQTAKNAVFHCKKCLEANRGGHFTLSNK
jgi:hypothetical protein